MKLPVIGSRGDGAKRPASARWIKAGRHTELGHLAYRTGWLASPTGPSGTQKDPIPPSRAQRLPDLARLVRASHHRGLSRDRETRLGWYPGWG